jgi:hypothetical protein
VEQAQAFFEKPLVILPAPLLFAHSATTPGNTTGLQQSCTRKLHCSRAALNSW